MSTLTVAKYLRLSSEDTDLKQTGKLESNSIANQRNLLDAHISRIPELAGAEILEFCDDGWSGKNFERPAVQEMLLQVRQGKIQCIVVKDLSRFGRDYLTVGNYISRVFPFLGVRFIAVNDGLDSIRPMDVDSLDTSFKALLYDLYSRDLSRKVRDAKRFRAEKGYFLSPFAPFGYEKDPSDKNHLVVDPQAAETVRRIFQMAADGCGPVQIARTLNDEAVPPPMLYKRAAGCSRTVWPSLHEENFWLVNTIQRILRDERYIGKNVYGKQMRDRVGHSHTVKVSKADWITVEGSHEGIVDSELFMRAQDNMREYREHDVAAYGKTLLYKKVRCGVCGHVMERITAKKTYYRCRTPRLTDAYACPSENTPEENIVDILLADLRVQASVAVEMSRIWEEKRKRKQRSTESMQRSLTALKQTHERQSQQIKALYESFAMGEISKSEYLALKAAAVKERDYTGEEISRLIAELDNTDADGKLPNRFVTTFQKYSELDELTNTIVADVYESVFIYPQGQIKIVRKYQDELSALLLELEG